MKRGEYDSWLCLKTAPALSGRQILDILGLYPDPCEFVGNKSHPLYASGILKKVSAIHLSEKALPKNISQIHKTMDHYQIECLNIYEYPDRLKNIYAPPLILYYRGDVSKLTLEKNLAVVGTRKPSPYGSQILKKLLAPIIRRKVNIISGLALGIDTIAHETALAEGGNTVAVLACGLESIYPPRNLELAQRIVATGVIISEYEPGTKPDKWNFPARNRIISALSDLVFVVEGPINSGAMLTAKNAIQQGRDICALPGNINILNAEGPNHLLKNGAALVDSSKELAYLLGLEPTEEVQAELQIPLSEAEERICELLREAQKSLSFDELLIKSAFPIGKISTVLTNLELKGLLGKESGNSFFLL